MTKLSMSAQLASAWLLFLAAPASATVWDLSGVIETCNPLACGFGDIVVGDTLAGFLQADDAAGVPNSTLGAADIQDFLIAVIDMVDGTEHVRVGPADGATLVAAALGTDADGELTSGSADFFGQFDGGVVGNIAIDVNVDLDTGRFTVSTDFFNIGEVATGTIGFSLEPDADNVASILDNCTLVANTDQSDTDADGIGNACDLDVDQDCEVAFGDLNALKLAFFSRAGDAAYDPNLDFDVDDEIGFGDLNLLKLAFFSTPGPSGLPNACN